MSRPLTVHEHREKAGELAQKAEKLLTGALLPSERDALVARELMRLAALHVEMWQTLRP